MASTKTKKDDRLTLIWGARDIAKELGLEPQQTFRLLGLNHLPARKVGGKWCAERETLRAFFTTVPTSPQT